MQGEIVAVEKEPPAFFPVSAGRCDVDVRVIPQPVWDSSVFRTICPVMVSFPNEANGRVLRFTSSR